MCGVSDIPDWCWNEAGLPYTWLPADPVLLDTMWRKSPVSHVEEVTAPVFLMIGQQCGDRRDAKTWRKSGRITNLYV